MQLVLWGGGADYHEASIPQKRSQLQDVSLSVIMSEDNLNIGRSYLPINLSRSAAIHFHQRRDNSGLQMELCSDILGAA